MKNQKKFPFLTVIIYSLLILLVLGIYFIDRVRSHTIPSLFPADSHSDPENHIADEGLPKVSFEKETYEECDYSFLPENSYTTSGNEVIPDTHGNNPKSNTAESFKTLPDNTPAVTFKPRNSPPHSTKFQVTPSITPSPTSTPVIQLSSSQLEECITDAGSLRITDTSDGFLLRDPDSGKRMRLKVSESDGRINSVSLLFTMPTIMTGSDMLTVRHNERELKSAEITLRLALNTLYDSIIPFPVITQSIRDIWIEGALSVLKSGKKYSDKKSGISFSCILTEDSDPCLYITLSEE